MSKISSENSKRILIVDDEPSVTDVLKAILTKDGYEVHIANEGKSAVKMASELSPGLIFMDIIMPEISGYDVAAQMRALPGLEETPIIFLSGKSPSEDGGQAFSSGGALYVSKPFISQQIRSLVELTLMSVDE